MNSPFTVLFWYILSMKNITRVNNSYCTSNIAKMYTGNIKINMQCWAVLRWKSLYLVICLLFFGGGLTQCFLKKVDTDTYNLFLIIIANSSSIYSISIERLETLNGLRQWGVVDRRDAAFLLTLLVVSFIFSVPSLNRWRLCLGPHPGTGHVRSIRQNSFTNWNRNQTWH